MSITMVKQQTFDDLLAMNEEHPTDPVELKKFRMKIDISILIMNYFDTLRDGSGDRTT